MVLGCGSAGWVGQEEKELRAAEEDVLGMEMGQSGTAVGMGKGLQG